MGTSVVAISLLLTGCTVTAPQPVAPTINVDPNKSVDQQLEEVKTGFAKLYCPIRESKAADAIVDYAKGLWNDIVAKNPGAGIPPFDPNDPAMCKQ
jgi:hypothetical protein